MQTSQPSINDKNVSRSLNDTRVFKQIEENMGYAVVIQTNKGSKRPIRLNEDTLKIEVFVNEEWKSVIW